MFSIICIYNDQNILNDYLLHSLMKQTVPYELIAIDNSQQQYKSAPRIMNEVGMMAKHDYIMFVHQDVALETETWLEDVERELKELEFLGAAGVAGCDHEGTVANVMHGTPPSFVTIKQITKPVTKQTLDGCLIIIPKKVFEEIHFDEKTCDGWYLYASDYCLDLLRNDLKIYVLPDKIYHLSLGPSYSQMYIDAVNKIIKKHRGHFKIIYTTTGIWDTRKYLFQIGIIQIKKALQRLFC